MRHRGARAAALASCAVAPRPARKSARRSVRALTPTLALFSSQRPRTANGAHFALALSRSRSFSTRISTSTETCASIFSGQNGSPCSTLLRSSQASSSSSRSQTRTTRLTSVRALAVAPILHRAGALPEAPHPLRVRASLRHSRRSPSPSLPLPLLPPFLPHCPTSRGRLAPLGSLAVCESREEQHAGAAD